MDGVSYSDGYLVNATYANAPYSCDGGIVMANVEIFKYSQCIFNNGIVVNETQYNIRVDGTKKFYTVRSYRRLLDVCKFFTCNNINDL